MGKACLVPPGTFSEILFTPVKKAGMCSLVLRGQATREIPSSQSRKVPVQ